MRALPSQGSSPGSRRRGTEAEGGSVEETTWKGEQWPLQQAPRVGGPSAPVQKGGTEAGRNSLSGNNTQITEAGNLQARLLLAPFPFFLCACLWLEGTWAADQHVFKMREMGYHGS